MHSENETWGRVDSCLWVFRLCLKVNTPSLTEFTRLKTFWVVEVHSFPDTSWSLKNISRPDPVLLSQFGSLVTVSWIPASLSIYHYSITVICDDLYAVGSGILTKYNACSNGLNTPVNVMNIWITYFGIK